MIVSKVRNFLVKKTSVKMYLFHIISIFIYFLKIILLAMKQDMMGRKPSVCESNFSQQSKKVIICLTFILHIFKKTYDFLFVLHSK